LSQRKKYVVLFIVMVMVVLAILLVYFQVKYMEYPPSGSYIPDSWQVSFASKTFVSDGRYRALRSKDEIGVYTYTTTVHLCENKDMFLVISRPVFRGLDIFVNGKLVGSIGDMKMGRSNMWNGTFLFPISSQTPTVNITLKGYALFARGFYIPVFVVPRDIAQMYVMRNNILSENIFAWATGASILLFITFLMIAFSGRVSIGKVYYYFGLGMPFLSIVLFDNVVQLLLPVDYVFYQKALVIASLVAPLFIHMGVMELLFDKGKSPMLSRILSYALVLLAVVVALWWGDILSLVRFTSYAMIMIPVVIIYDVYMFIKDILIRSTVPLTHLVIFIGLVAETILLLYDIVAKVVMLARPVYMVFYAYYGLIFAMLGVYISLIYDYIYVYESAGAEHKLAMELKDASETDELTGVYNRRYLHKIAQTVEGRVCILMIDIDHFKKVNDTYGHLAGDTVLKELVDVIRRQLRAHDVLVRYGGEEFLVILTDTLPDAAVHIAERIKKAIEKYEFVVKSDYIHKIHITVSVGVSCGLIPAGGSSYIVWNLIAKADEALYMAKSAGRNRVISSV